MKLSLVTLCAALCAAFCLTLSSPVLAQNGDAGPAPALDAGPAPLPADAGPTEPAKAESDPVKQAEESPLSAGTDLVNAVRNGNWRVAAALALGLLMMFAGKYRDKVKWFKGDRGGAVLVMALSLAGAVSTALVSDATLDWKLFVGAAGVAWTAVGGYTWVKRLIWPKDTESK